MANSEVVSDVVVAAPTVKVPILPLLLCVMAAALMAVGGAAGVVFYLAKSGRIHLGGSAEAPAVKAAVEVPTHALAMEPLLANLADADGRAYLRLGVVLQIEDASKKGKEKEADPKAPSAETAQFRDSVLEVLGRARSADLLAVDGKEQLKRQLKEKFAQESTAAKVREIYFTDFLVQR